MARKSGNTGDFVVHYRPNAGKQEVAIKLKNYKGRDENKVFAMWESQYEKFLSCQNTSAFTAHEPKDSEKTAEFRNCSERFDKKDARFCKKLATGRYSVGGGMTEGGNSSDSNPVTLTFDTGGVNKIVRFNALTKGKTANIEFEPRIRICDASSLKEFKGG